MIPDEDIENVRFRVDIVGLFSEYTQVKRKGADYWCCCPFHKEKTPSCKIDVASANWHCFGCGEGGSVFNFVMKKQGVNFPEAVHILAEKTGVEIHDDFKRGQGVSSDKRTKMYDCMNAAVDFFEKCLLTSKSDEAGNARKYLASRNFGIDVAKRWKLGYAPAETSMCAYLMKEGFDAKTLLDCNLAVERGRNVADRFFGRVMFPIFNTNGSCIAFGGRVLGDGNPKYLNSKETPIFHKSNVLFGMNVAQSEIVASGSAIVVEGYTDVIAMHEAGFKNVVATLGTSLTIQHIKLLSRYANKNIIYLFDGDEAGQRAAERALKFIDYTITPESGAVRCSLCAAVIPDKMDPMEYITNKGADAMREILDNPRELIDFGIDRIISNSNLNTKEDRMRAAREAVSILASIKETDIAKDYARQIAHRTLLEERELANMLSNLKPVVNNWDEELTPYNTDFEESNISVPAEFLEDQAKKLPEETNRSKIEKTVLSICSQFPQIALQYADELLSIKWEVSQHKQICERIYDVLGVDLGASSDKILTECTEVLPEASGILTYELGISENDAPKSFRAALALLETQDLKENMQNLSLKLNDKSADETQVREIMIEMRDKQQKLLELEAKSRKMME